MQQTALWKRALALLLFLLALAGFISLASRALSPYENGTGVCWRRYRAERPRSIDVLYFGSSFQFCDVSPAVVYERAGLTGYVVGGPSQSPSVTWYYLKESLHTQSPRAVVVELNCAGYHAKTNYPEINIGMMPYSVNRVAAAFEAGTAENRAGLLFPLYSYHSNWNQLTLAQMRQRLTDKSLDLSAGYCLYRGVFPEGAWSQGGFDTESPAFIKNLTYYGNMIRLCNRRGILLYFAVNPLTARVAPADIERLRLRLASLGGEWTLIDGGAHADALALDPRGDYFDESHMNASGAEKYSAFLADTLLAALGSPTDPARYDRALWEKRVRWFYDSPEGTSTAYAPAGN